MVMGTSAERGQTRLYVRMEGLPPFALIVSEDLSPEALEYVARQYVRDRYGSGAGTEHLLVRRINFAGSDKLMDFAKREKTHSIVKSLVNKTLTGTSTDHVGNNFAFVKTLPAYHGSESPEAIRGSYRTSDAPVLDENLPEVSEGGGAAAFIPSSTYMSFIGFCRLVRMMTDPHNPQRDLFTRVVLLTYRQFATPEELFEQLIERYEVPALSRPGESDRSPLAHQFYTELRRDIQRAVFNVLELWVENYYEDFSNDVLFHRLVAFSKEKIDQSGAPAALLSLMARGDRTALNSSKPTVLPGVARGGETPTAVLIQYSPREIAAQLTILTSYVHRQFKGPELLGQRWNTDEANSIRNFIQYRDFFSCVNNWVSYAVVSERDLSHRSKNLDLLMVVCDELIKLRNWDMLVAVHGGMRAPAVKRLSRTWASLSRETAELSTRLRKMLGSDADHKTFKETMRKGSRLQFPCVTLFLQEMKVLEESKCSQEGLVNFGRCLQQYRLLQTLLQGKEVRVDHLMPKNELLGTFSTWVPVDASLLMQLSEEAEKP
ncbi:guanine nucleotide releasing protein [Trypanosoma cruzi]|nr:guanine nucleotide releasing protein [Trypanosoma cruzi]